MARLRGAATRAPGHDYTVLDVTRVPEHLLGYQSGDEPTDSEWAKHSALTLYATHQQSIRDIPMHRDGQTLGAAIGLLCHAETVSAEAVRRRFTALGTATSYDATLYHLRGLVGQLRQHRIALDYGLLADDLLKLLRPGGRERVRALWGRDFYRSAASDHDRSESVTTDTEE
jgi:CRISPR system Cascade subunit CasB